MEKSGKLFSGTVTDRFGDRFNRVTEVRILFHILLDILDGIYNSRVIAVAEFLADRGKCHLCDLMHQIDRDLAGVGDLLRTLLRADIVRGDAVQVGDLLNDVLDRDRCRLLVRQDIAGLSWRVSGR